MRSRSFKEYDNTRLYIQNLKLSHTVNPTVCSLEYNEHQSILQAKTNILTWPVPSFLAELFSTLLSITTQVSYNDSPNQSTTPRAIPIFPAVTTLTWRGMPFTNILAWPWTFTCFSTPATDTTIFNRVFPFREWFCDYRWLLGLWSYESTVNLVMTVHSLGIRMKVEVFHMLLLKYDWIDDKAARWCFPLGWCKSP